MKKVFFLIVSALIFGLVFTGCSDIANITGPATVNTDGNLYKCEPCVQGDTATGMGEKIKEKGKWFMFNVYPYSEDKYAFVDYYDIVAGNPKNGKTVIGGYWIEKNGDYYTAYYDIDPINHTFVVVDEHLAISDSQNFTAAPGKDDNADFGVPFYDEDGEFFIFAHFAVECR